MRTTGLPLAAAAFWSACSTASPARPPALGDCVASQDAGCAVPLVGVATASDASGGLAVDAGSGVSTEGGTCGVASALLNATSGNCVPCVAGACCLADQACSNGAACLFLLQCARACQQGDTLCFGNCQNQQPTGIVAYNDLAQCLLANCTPSCPTLPQ